MPVASSVSVEIAIVGGGIVGASCAYFLAERGARPLLLESGLVGREASGANAGGVRQQGRLLAEMPLAIESVRLWADLEQRLATTLDYDRCGDLRLAETPDDALRLRELAAREAAAGLRLEWVEDDDLRRLVPALSRHVLAGTFAPTGGQANPLVVASAFGRRARTIGATVWEHCAVQHLRRDGQGYALDSARGVLHADRVILAAGAWTGELAEHLGIRLPVRLFVPQMVATAPLPPVLGVVLLGVSRRLSMKQTRRGAILIGGGKRGRGDLRTRAKHPAAENIGLSALDAAAVLPVLARAEATRSWVGLEALTADELPVIERLPRHDVYVATGFSGHGFAIGPVVGRLLAEWLLDGRPSLDLSAFSASRFHAT